VRASKTELDDSAPMESVGTIDDTAHSSIDSSAHSSKKTRARSHRERRGEQMNQIEMDDVPHSLDVLDGLERPGAHRVDTDEAHADDESNTIIVQEPNEDGQDHATEGVTVTATAWVVERENAPGNSMDTILDVENQDQPADIPEAVVQKGLMVWILGHIKLTWLMIVVLIAVVGVGVGVSLDLTTQMQKVPVPTEAISPAPASNATTVSE
jgi:hypothetical protein